MSVKSNELPDLIAAAVQKALLETQAFEVEQKMLAAKSNVPVPARFPWWPIGLFFKNATGAETAESIRTMQG